MIGKFLGKSIRAIKFGSIGFVKDFAEGYRGTTEPVVRKKKEKKAKEPKAE